MTHKSDMFPVMDEECNCAECTKQNEPKEKR